MGSPFSPLSLFDNDPESRFLNLYNRFQGQNQGQELGEFLDPEDPDAIKYRELMSSPTGSEDMISDYVESRPEREDFAPGLGKKFGAFLIGMLGGRGEAGARQFLDRPYEQATEDWKSEGQNISTRARLMDAERSRELGGLKTTLGMKERALRARSTDEFKRNQESRRVADEIASAEEKQKEREREIGHERKTFDLRKEIFNNQKSMEAWRKEEALRDNTRAEDTRKKLDEEKASKASSLDQINKNLSAFASQQGVDTSDYGSALDIAQELAHRKAKAHPAFGDLLEETDDGWKLVDTSAGRGDTSYIQRQKVLENYIKSLTQKYLRGEFK